MATVFRGDRRLPPIMYGYVDASYVRRELLDAGLNPEFDPRRIFRNVYSYEPRRLYFYDALDNDPAKQTQQNAYLDRLERLPQVHLHSGEIRVQKRNRRQKGVDVALACDALIAAFRGHAEIISIVAGDGDFVPLVRALREFGPLVHVLGF